LKRLCLIASSFSLAGCDGIQDAMNPHGPFAARITTMSWIIFAVSTVIFLITMFFLWKAVRRAHLPETRLNERQGWKLVMLSGIAVPLVILFAFLIYSVRVANVNAKSLPDDALTIEARGHQFWWDFIYKNNANPSLGARVSNEIHIPVGKPVEVELHSMDVIHSFWVPNLHGKMDMIPGRTTRIALQADRPGVFRGQCAEFCGLQHAHMAFLVVAEPEEQFNAWLDHQRSPAIEPTDPVLLRGQEVFLTTSCVLCHAIRGTIALAAVAPDLTHIGSRSTLAAGTLPNTPGHLGGWIADPQAIKPGNRMPPNQLPASDLTALVRYLGSLK
jgi:cytochrome c oxidase subunit II